MNTPVTPHFKIEELYASATAKAKGIDNKPPIQPLICLVYLAAYVLEPLRSAMGEPIRISSGYRCEPNKPNYYSKKSCYFFKRLSITCLRLRP